MPAANRDPPYTRGMRLLSKLLCLLALLACVPLARAQATQPVYRCIGAQGEPVFSGQPCGTPAAQPGTTAGMPGAGSAGVCAGSPSALRQSIAQAFATHDVNQFAGLLLWRGMGQASARATLASLSAWLRQPLTGIAVARAAGPPPTHDVPASGTSGAPPVNASSSALPPTGYAVSTGGVDGHTRDFGVVESGGCWWLTF